MAGGWIKLEYQTPHKPEIVRIASALGADILRTLGACCCCWILFDQHADAEGRLDGYSAAALDQLVGLPGFTEAMAAVGWMKIESQALITLDFEKHHGAGAKRRANDAKRKRDGRASAPKTDKSPHATRTAVRNGSGQSAAQSQSQSKSHKTSPSDPPGDDWQWVEEELAKEDVSDLAVCLKTARDAGRTTEAIRALLIEYRAEPRRWGPGALYRRVTGQLAAWPPPDVAAEKTKGRAETAAHAAKQTAANQVQLRERDEQVEREKLLEKNYGKDLDEMAPVDREALVNRLFPDPDERRLSGTYGRRMAALSFLAEQNGKLEKAGDKR